MASRASRAGGGAGAGSTRSRASSSRGRGKKRGRSIGDSDDSSAAAVAAVKERARTRLQRAAEALAAKQRATQRRARYVATKDTYETRLQAARSFRPDVSWTPGQCWPTPVMLLLQNPVCSRSTASTLSRARACVVVVTARVCVIARDGAFDRRRVAVACHADRARRRRAVVVAHAHCRAFAFPFAFPGCTSRRTSAAT